MTSNQSASLSWCRAPISHTYFNGVHYIYNAEADQRVDIGCDRADILWVSITTEMLSTTVTVPLKSTICVKFPQLFPKCPYTLEVCCCFYVPLALSVKQI
jgi:hypothetical protein